MIAAWRVLRISAGGFRSDDGPTIQSVKPSFLCLAEAGAFLNFLIISHRMASVSVLRYHASMSSAERIAKNAAWLMGATALQKVVAFLTFIVVSHLVGDTQTGVFFYSVAITSIFVSLTDLGMTPVVIRAIAGGRTEGAIRLAAALRAKLVLIPLAIAGSLIYAWADGADRTIFISVLIACGVMTADSIHLIIYGTLRGRQNLKPEALGMFVGQLLTASLSVTAAYLGAGPIGLVGALLAGSLWNVWWSLIQTRGTFQLPSVAWSDLRSLAIEALPFGLAGLAVKVYSYVDSLFIKSMHGPAAVGWYAVGYKLTYAFQFLPLTLTAALYPAFAAAFAQKNTEELRKTFAGSLRLMAAIGFPLTAGLSALAPKIIPFLYQDKFVEAIPSFAILPWVLIPIFLDFPIGSLLNATHRAHQKTGAMIATMIVNVVLNAMLVPRFGPSGAAWAGVGSFWLLYAIGAWLTRVEIGGMRIFVWMTVRSLFAAGISWYAWRVIAAPMSLFAAAVFGGAIALIMAFVMKFVTVEDAYRLIKRARSSAALESLHES